MSQIESEARNIIDRLAKVNKKIFEVDREAIEKAMSKHIDELGLKQMPFHWENDAGLGYEYVAKKTIFCLRPVYCHSFRESPLDDSSPVWSSAESAAWDAARSTAERLQRSNPVVRNWSVARAAAMNAAFNLPTGAHAIPWSAARTPWSSAKYKAIWSAFVEAFEAGLWLFWVYEDEIVLVERPSISEKGGRLHNSVGPAVAWRNGTKYWFWNGVQVEQSVIEHPELITLSKIEMETNVELRRVLIERYGLAKYMQNNFVSLVSKDKFGELLSRSIIDDEPIFMVKLKNSSPEPDGTFKDYFLRVPPTMKTARQAVAWTFGFEENEYELDYET